MPATLLYKGVRIQLQITIEDARSEEEALDELTRVSQVMVACKYV